MMDRKNKGENNGQKIKTSKSKKTSRNDRAIRRDPLPIETSKRSPSFSKIA